MPKLARSIQIVLFVVLSTLLLMYPHLFKEKYLFSMLAPYWFCLIAYLVFSWMEDKFLSNGFLALATSLPLVGIFWGMHYGVSFREYQDFYVGNGVACVLYLFVLPGVFYLANQTIYLNRLSK